MSQCTRKICNFVYKKSVVIRLAVFATHDGDLFAQYKYLQGGYNKMFVKICVAYATNH